MMCMKLFLALGALTFVGLMQGSAAKPRGAQAKAGAEKTTTVFVAPYYCFKGEAFMLLQKLGDNYSPLSYLIGKSNEMLAKQELMKNTSNLTVYNKPLELDSAVKDIRFEKDENIYYYIKIKAQRAREAAAKWFTNSDILMG